MFTLLWSSVVAGEEQSNDVGEFNLNTLSNFSHLKILGTAVEIVETFLEIHIIVFLPRDE